MKRECEAEFCACVDCNARTLVLSNPREPSGEQYISLRRGINKEPECVLFASIVEGPYSSLGSKSRLPVAKY